jgi:hypothetical protein
VIAKAIRLASWSFRMVYPSLSPIVLMAIAI